MKAKFKQPKIRADLVIRLGEKLRTQFKIACARRGYSMAGFLRNHILELLKKDQPHEKR